MPKAQHGAEAAFRRCWIDSMAEKGSRACMRLRFAALGGVWGKATAGHDQTMQGPTLMPRWTKMQKLSCIRQYRLRAAKPSLLATKAGTYWHASLAIEPDSPRG